MSYNIGGVHITFMWRLLGFSVTDVDECADGDAKCDDDADCVNIAPGFQCSCKEGYFGNGTVCTKNCDEGMVLVSDDECAGEIKIALLKPIYETGLLTVVRWLRGYSW